VVAETSWVLESVYGRTHEEIVTAIAMLLDHKHLAIQDPDVSEAALAGFRKNKNVSFSDLLILEIARKNGHLPLGSFDRELAKIEGSQPL
jgi:predicted nucleic-acid-binding protein